MPELFVGHVRIQEPDCLRLRLILHLFIEDIAESLQWEVIIFWNTLGPEA
ncbi:MAG: hypothetical protein RBG13Loki_0080 [Promethearchaeota archaeon CR_4]|nr:MAG: hypothetical protein RBG13Loki_0080 [Candidatus Lokiarchaeota archaeon CR_4]